MLPNLFWVTGHEGDKSTSKPGEPVELISERQLQRQQLGACLFLIGKQKVQKSKKINKQTKS